MSGGEATPAAQAPGDPAAAPKAPRRGARAGDGASSTPASEGEASAAPPVAEGDAPIAIVDEESNDRVFDALNAVLNARQVAEETKLAADRSALEVERLERLFLRSRAPADHERLEAERKALAMARDAASLGAREVTSALAALEGARRFERDREGEIERGEQRARLDELTPQATWKGFRARLAPALDRAIEHAVGLAAAIEEMRGAVGLQQQIVREAAGLAATLGVHVQLHHPTEDQAFAVALTTLAHHPQRGVLSTIKPWLDLPHGPSALSYVVACAMGVGGGLPPPSLRNNPDGLAWALIEQGPQLPKSPGFRRYLGIPG